MPGYSVGAPVDCETVALALLLAAHPRVLVVGRFCLGEFTPVGNPAALAGESFESRGAVNVKDFKTFKIRWW